MTASKLELVKLVHVSPRHAGQVGQLGTKGDSRYTRWERVAQRGLEKCCFFCSGIHTAPAARVRRRRIGYQQIAQAGSFQGMYWSPLDSPPRRSYNAASGRAEILGFIFGSIFSGRSKNKKGGGTTHLQGVIPSNTNIAGKQNGYSATPY